MKHVILCITIGVGLLLLLGLTGSSIESRESYCEHGFGLLRQNASEYEIIHANTLHELEDAVVVKLKKDWYPIGGLSIVDSNSFCQVMVK